MNKTIFDEHSELADTLAEEIARYLSHAVALRGTASIAFSGGSTPVLLFKALAKKNIDWSNVQITLVDERCVAPDHHRSNARLVQEHLLDNLSNKATFFPLFLPGESISERNSRFAALQWPLDVAIFGMGDDGHTASFFPGAKNLADLLDSEQADRILPTRSVPDNEPRVTWTLAALLEARKAVLHICGEKKERVLHQALKQLETAPALQIDTSLPVTHLLAGVAARCSGSGVNDPGPGAPTPLEIYFSRQC